MTSARPQIDNAESLIQDLESFTHLHPDGTTERTEVVTNRADNLPPNLLRVFVPRKSTTTPKILEYIHNHDQDLQVGDVHQLDTEYEDERVCFHIEPVEGGDD